MSRNYVFVFVLWLAGAAMASPAAAAKAAATPHQATRPSIILITLDTTRADRMGFLGSTRGLTPHLDALARQSVVFTRAYSQVPLTTASHATILTGTYPQFHKVDDFGIPLAPDLPYAPDILHSQGYHTAAFISSLILDPGAATAPGFDRGFDTYDAGFRRGAPGEDRYQTIERRAGVVVEHVLTWLNQHPNGPYFLWVHLYDAHDPYDPPEPYKTRYKSAPYDGEIAYVDSAVGKLLTSLRARGLYENSLIAVMADHGESLGAHGEDTHGVFLYDETIRVPLLFKLPHESAAGKRVASRVGLVDVLPTILQATGVEIPKDVQGQSLLEMARPVRPSDAKSSQPLDVSPDRPAFAVSDYPQRAFGWSPLESWRSGKYLFIEAPRKELYDQTADPAAEHNLDSKSSAVSETLASQLHAFRQKTTSDRVASGTNESPEMQEKLAALGYVSSDGTAAVRSGAKETAADPKDKIEIANLFRQASVEMEDQQYDDAVGLLEQVIAREPDTATAYRQLANGYMALREFAKAAVVARKAAELRPEWAIPHYLLGTALAASKDYAAAVPEFQTVVERMPRWTQAHVALGSTYVRTNKLPEAIKEYQTAIELDPDYYPAYLLVGRVFTATGDYPGALENLTKAAALNPTAPEAHRFLADSTSKWDAKRTRNGNERNRSESPPTPKCR